MSGATNCYGLRLVRERSRRQLGAWRGSTSNLRLFADLGRMPSLVIAVPFFEHSRLSFRIDNLFDAQQRVTDANGLVLLSYLPGFLDPRG